MLHLKRVTRLGFLTQRCDPVTHVSPLDQLVDSKTIDFLPVSKTVLTPGTDKKHRTVLLRHFHQTMIRNTLRNQLKNTQVQQDLCAMGLKTQPQRNVSRLDNAHRSKPLGNGLLNHTEGDRCFTIKTKNKSKIYRRCGHSEWTTT